MALRVVVCGLLLLSFLLVSGGAPADSDNSTIAEQGDEFTTTSRLKGGLADIAALALKLGEELTEHPLWQLYEDNGFIVDEDKVSILATPIPGASASTLLAELVPLGFEGVASAAGGLVGGAMPAANLYKLDDPTVVPSLFYASPAGSDSDTTSSRRRRNLQKDNAESGGNATSEQRDAACLSTCCRASDTTPGGGGPALPARGGAALTQGDVPLVTTYAADIASNDLPAGIDLTLEGAAGAVDEGRAMAQIVADIAPGATITFATAGNNPTTFEENIRTFAALPGGDASLGNVIPPATVMVHDIWGRPEPASGNMGEIAYTAPGFRPAPSGAGAGANSVFHDFATAGPEDIDLDFVNEPWIVHGNTPPAVGSRVDMNLLIFRRNAAGNYAQAETIAGTITVQQGNTMSGGDNPLDQEDPYEFASVINTACVGNLDLSLRIEWRTNTGPQDAAGNRLPPTYMKIVGHNNNGDYERNPLNAGVAEVELSSASATGSRHSRLGASIASMNYCIGATPGSNNPRQPAWDTGMHGTPIIFLENGNCVATGAPRPNDGYCPDPMDPRLQPLVTAPHGVDTTHFATRDRDNTGALPVDIPPFTPNRNFFGTSAAGPHVAGLAALLRQHDPTLTPAQIYERIASSAVDIIDIDLPANFRRAPDNVNGPQPGSANANAFDFVTGAGFVTSRVGGLPLELVDVTPTGVVGTPVLTVELTFNQINVVPIGANPTLQLRGDFQEIDPCEARDPDIVEIDIDINANCTSANVAGQTVFTCTIPGGGITDTRGLRWDILAVGDTNFEGCVGDAATLPTPIGEFWTRDTRPPEVVLTSPANGDVRVPLDTGVEVVFDEVVVLDQPATVTLTATWVEEDPCEVFKLPSPPIEIPLTASMFTACTLTIPIPPPGLQGDGFRYEVNIPREGIRDDRDVGPPPTINGRNNPASDVQISFTAVDVVPPRVGHFNPIQSAVGIPPDTQIVMTFDELIALGNVPLGSGIFLHPDAYLDSGGRSLPPLEISAEDVVVDRCTLTINPPVDLLNGRVYTVIVDEGVVEDAPSQAPTPLKVPNGFAGLVLPGTDEPGQADSYQFMTAGCPGAVPTSDYIPTLLNTKCFGSMDFKRGVKTKAEGEHASNEGITLIVGDQTVLRHDANADAYSAQRAAESVSPLGLIATLASVDNAEEQAIIQRLLTALSAAKTETNAFAKAVLPSGVDDALARLPFGDIREALRGLDLADLVPTDVQALLDLLPDIAIPGFDDKLACWIGLRRAAKNGDGEFDWMDSTPFDFSDWKDTILPDTLEEAIRDMKDCVKASLDDGWYGDHCFNKLPCSLVSIKLRQPVLCNVMRTKGFLPDAATPYVDNPFNTQWQWTGEFLTGSSLDVKQTYGGMVFRNNVLNLNLYFSTAGIPTLASGSWFIDDNKDPDDGFLLRGDLTTASGAPVVWVDPGNNVAQESGAVFCDMSCYEAGRELVTATIATVAAPHAVACQEACQANAACTHFTFTGEECLLKAAGDKFRLQGFPYVSGPRTCPDILCTASPAAGCPDDTAELPVAAIISPPETCCGIPRPDEEANRCSLPPAQSLEQCDVGFTAYSFDSGECVERPYGGCGGNRNLFVSSHECRAVCEKKRFLAAAKEGTA
ncbi:unnamed protein product [Vitrella brassicaformis CCMP3155]|uniref:subtilisin n=5 Tax=Vitrella brassicaformis TaxID=1169539 RepID=A0A0G4F4H5_VITBC|nr:unnamed protein product [Vitrella brassicaformis CCMP3155]|eukprot:CEM06639.1 unnamed protein product [Vitrella brassicaformis CCMP3155]